MKVIFNQLYHYSLTVCYVMTSFYRQSVFTLYMSFWSHLYIFVKKNCIQQISALLDQLDVIFRMWHLWVFFFLAENDAKCLRPWFDAQTVLKRQRSSMVIWQHGINIRTHNIGCQTMSMVLCTSVCKSHITERNSPIKVCTVLFGFT